MFRPARMTHLNVLVLDHDVDRATEEMIRSGLVHLISVTELEPWVDQEGLKTLTAQEPEDSSELEGTARALAEKLGFGPEIVSAELAFQSFDPQQARQQLEDMRRDVTSVISARVAAEEKLRSLQQTETQVHHDVWSKLGVDFRSRHTLLELVVGRLPEKNVDTLRRLLSEIPNVVLTFPEERGYVAVMVITLKRDRDALQKAVEQVALERLPVPEERAPLSEEMMTQLHKRIQEAKKELRLAQDAVEECKKKHFPALRAILSQARLRSLSREAKRRFRKTAKTCLISGWTPRHAKQAVVESLKAACEGRCLIEEQAAEKVIAARRGEADVPILFENPKLLKPFEMLVSNYGRPDYDSVEPTFIVAPAFLLMFGVMFGDVGQGLVMALLGAFVASRKRLSEGIRRIGELFIWCGSSATLFGFFYASVFGFTDLLPYEGYEPLRNVGTFLTLAIYFGLGFISLGVLFNIATAIRKREWAEGVSDWSGLFGLALYWLLVILVVQFFSRGRVSSAILLGIAGLLLVGAVLRVALERFSRGQRAHPDEGTGVSLLRAFGHGVGTLFESFLGFLTNTISFLRIAAFAAAHGALASAVLSMGEVVSGSGSRVLIHVLGNAVIIALEGLVVCVQALRLMYYEFFSRFFRTGGTEYRPIKLSAKAP